jgi:cytidine deaminase
VANSPVDEQLLDAARAACAHAYAPYSEFAVGVALLSATGKIYAGANVENAAYPLGSCAERSAVGAAVTAEGPSLRIEKVVIVTGTGQVAAPCGGCRQVLNEFGPDAEILLVGSRDELRIGLVELLPHAFGPHDLPSRSHT